jgi:hypothetical protein
MDCRESKGIDQPSPTVVAFDARDGGRWGQRSGPVV